LDAPLRRRGQGSVATTDSAQRRCPAHADQPDGAGRPERAARLSGVRDARGAARGGAVPRHRSAGRLPKDELATMIVAADLQALPGNNDHAVHAVDVERHDIELAIQRRRAERHPFFLTGEELTRVFRWKLRGLHERTAAQRGRNTEAAYRLISQ